MLFLSPCEKGCYKAGMKGVFPGYIYREFRLWDLFSAKKALLRESVFA